MKIIEVKNELLGLRYDADLALLSGADPEKVLNMAMTKICNILQLETKSYVKVVWKR